VAPPNHLMNSRRLIASPKAQDKAPYQVEPVMSALGQKRTYAVQADICGAIGDVRFSPNADRESGLPQNGMSALPPKAFGHKQTLMRLLDYLFAF